MAAAVASAIFGARLGYIAVNLPTLLRTKPGFIKKVLLGRLALAVLMFLSQLGAGHQPAAVVSILITGAIYYYLVKSVTRLFAQAAALTLAA